MSLNRAIQDAAEPTERRIANDQIMIAQMRMYNALKREEEQKKKEDRKDRLEAVAKAPATIKKQWWQKCLNKVWW